tara:strand:- start:1529 stop:1726 length:198 start_codon:yes stop_codon:yes gene_type:complete
MSGWRAVLKDADTKQGKLTDYMSFSATVSPLDAKDWFKKPVKRKNTPKQPTDTVQTRLDGTVEEE